MMGYRVAPSLTRWRTDCRVMLLWPDERRRAARPRWCRKAEGTPSGLILDLESRDERQPCHQTSIPDVGSRPTKDARPSTIWMYEVGSSLPILISAGRIACSLGNFGTFAQANSKERSAMCNMTALSQFRPFVSQQFASILTIAC